MQTDTPSESGYQAQPRFESTAAWKGGALAGALAATVMGVLVTVMDLTTLRVLIAGLYGLSGSLVAGWVTHLVHGTIFGVIFAAVLSDPGLYRLTDWRWKTALAGLVYGLLLAIVAAGIVMPIWLRAAGLPDPPAAPFVTTSSLLWHGVYGLVLGAIMPSVVDV